PAEAPALIHDSWRAAPRSLPLPCGKRVGVRALQQSNAAKPRLPPLPCGERVGERAQSCLDPSSVAFLVQPSREPPPHIRPSGTPDRVRGRLFSPEGERERCFLRAPLHHQLLDLRDRLG